MKALVRGDEVQSIGRNPWKLAFLTLSALIGAYVLFSILISGRNYLDAFRTRSEAAVVQANAGKSAATAAQTQAEIDRILITGDWPAARSTTTNESEAMTAAERNQFLLQAIDNYAEASGFPEQSVDDIKALIRVTAFETAYPADLGTKEEFLNIFSDRIEEYLNTRVDRGILTEREASSIRNALLSKTEGDRYNSFIEAVGSSSDERWSR